MARTELDVKTIPHSGDVVRGVFSGKDGTAKVAVYVAPHVYCDFSDGDKLQFTIDEWREGARECEVLHVAEA